MVLIPKGSKLFCKSCGEWLATAKRDLKSGAFISEENIESVWKVNEECRCPKCEAYTQNTSPANWSKP